MGKKCVPPVAMVLVQLGFAGMNVVSKLALDAGMSPYVLIAYRNLIAAAVISPVAYFVERYCTCTYAKQTCMYRYTFCMLIVIMFLLIGVSVHWVYVSSFTHTHTPLACRSRRLVRLLLITVHRAYVSVFALLVR
jgi:hypothetical protein